MKTRLFQRGPIWWLDVRDGPLRKKVSTGCTSRIDADRVAPELALKTLVGLRSAPSSPTAEGSGKGTPQGITLEKAFATAMLVRESWIKSKDKESLRNTYNQIAEDLGEDFDISKLTRDFVRELRTKWLAQPGKRKGSTLSASTVNGRLSMLSVLLDANDLPPHLVKHMSVDGNQRTRRVNQDEIRKMQAWLLANSHRKGALTLHDMVTVALQTGARAGELTDILHGDVRLDDMTMTLRGTKNGETRTVPVDEASKRILEARRGQPDGPFADLSKAQRSTLIREMREGMGLDGDEELVFHILRHEAASRMVAAGIHPSVIQHIMGHKNYKTTERYVKVNVEAMKEAVAQRAQFEALRDAPAAGTVQ